MEVEEMEEEEEEKDQTEEQETLYGQQSLKYLLSDPHRRSLLNLAVVYFSERTYVYGIHEH